MRRSERRIIETETAPKAIGPYSQAVEAGLFLFLSGQIPLDPRTGDMVVGGIKEQTARVLENIRSVLSAAGLGMEDLVKTTVFMTDLSQFGEMNSVYAEAFGEVPPARAAVQVVALPKGALVEIEGIALRSREA